MSRTVPYPGSPIQKSSGSGSASKPTIQPEPSAKPGMLKAYGKFLQSQQSGPKPGMLKAYGQFLQSQQSIGSAKPEPAVAINKMYLKHTITAQELQTELSKKHANMSPATINDHINAVANGNTAVYQGQHGGMVFVTPQKTEAGPALYINNLTDQSVMNHHNMKVLRGHAKALGLNKIVAHSKLHSIVHEATTKYGFKSLGQTDIGTLLVHGVM